MRVLAALLHLFMSRKLRTNQSKFAKMDPLALQMQLRNNSSDLTNFCEDLKQWGEEMKRKDETLKTGTESTDTHVPLARGKVKTSTNSSKPNSEKVRSKTTKRLKSFDDWEKFDVDAECAKVDEERTKSEDSGELTDEYDENAQDQAFYEKEKGNKFVKKQRWDDAIECYTRAIEYYAYDPIFYANRALCHLKKQNYRAAESDSTSALQLDKTYVKAYQRRAVAREALNQMTEAHEDLLKVFDYEPNNKESKAALAKLEKKLENFNKEVSIKKSDVQRPKSKFTISRQQQKENKSYANQNKEASSKANNANKSHVIQNQDAATSSNAEIVKKSEVKSLSNKSPNLGPTKIATYWPSGNEIELVHATHKPPHLRSKKPLKRVNIQDIDVLNFDIETEIKPAENIEIQEIAEPLPKPDSDNRIIKCDDFKVVENKKEDYNKGEKRDFREKTKESKFVKEKINNKISKNENIKDVELEEFNLSVPETSVQFNTDWRLLNDKPDLRYCYLKQVNPKKFAVIFKESLDCDVFSGIIQTLAEMFIENHIPVYEYLLGLCEVKRFSMLSMFMSEDEKKDLFKLADYMRSDSSLSNTNINNLLSKYGL